VLGRRNGDRELVILGGRARSLKNQEIENRSRKIGLETPKQLLVTIK